MRFRALPHLALAAALVIAATGPSAVEAADQDDLQRRQIEARLQKKSLDREADVRVEVSGGQAVLSGIALTVHAREQAEREALEVVDAVENHLRVVPEEVRTDSELAEAVSDAVLRYPFYTVFDSVEGRVVDGVVELGGSVLMPHRKEDIERRIAKIPGVRAIESEIAVQPVSIHDSRLRQQIARAIYGDPRFARYSNWANPPIRIVVDRGRLTLTGVVSSPVEQAKRRKIPVSPWNR